MRPAGRQGGAAQVGTGDYQKAVQGPDEIRWHRLAPQQLRSLKRALGRGDRYRKLRADSLGVSEKSSPPCSRPVPAVRSGLNSRVPPLYSRAHQTSRFPMPCSGPRVGAEDSGSITRNLRVHVAFRGGSQVSKDQPNAGCWGFDSS